MWWESSLLAVFEALESSVLAALEAQESFLSAVWEAQESFLLVVLEAPESSSLAAVEVLESFPVVDVMESLWMAKADLEEESSSEAGLWAGQGRPWRGPV